MGADRCTFLGYRDVIISFVFSSRYRASDFWLNGEYLGHHSSGYTGFRFRVDGLSFAKLDGTPNLLAVRVDPRANEGWFYEGGGLYRHAWVRSAATAHVAPWGVYVPSEVDTQSIQRLASGMLVGNAKITITTELEGIGMRTGNEGTTGGGGVADGGGAWAVQSNITDREGNLLWFGTVAVAAGSSTTTQVAELTELTLWMPQNARACGWPGSCANGPAAMYSVATALVHGNLTVDETLGTRFGVRDLAFDPDRGLLVNRVPVKAKGMCNHQDFAGVGTAVPDRVQAFRVAQMQAYGVNAWRTAHNPPNAELLDALDDQGFLTMNENRNFGNHSTWRADFADMIKRDRNHPTVVWWSVCNEGGCKQASGDATLAVGKAFKAVIAQHDPVATRPMTGAWKTWGYNNASMDILWGTEVVDVSGWNYMSPLAYDTYHNATHRPMVASEHCSCQSDRTAFPNASARVRGAAASWPCIKDCWEPVANRSFVQGLFDWAGFDYRGENHWPETNAQYGMLDLAGFPKAGAFYYKEQFLPDVPVVQIVPGQWEPFTGGGQMEVSVYTNGDAVELLLNGAAVGAPQAVAPFDKAGWFMPFTPGNLTAVATKGGKPWGSDTRLTGIPGAASIVLSVVAPVVNVSAPLVADGQDVAILTATVLDRAGRVLHTAGQPEVTVTVSGPGTLLGIGNGDPRDHTPEGRTGSSVRRTFNGLLRILVETTTAPGEIKYEFFVTVLVAPVGVTARGRA